MSLRNAGKSRLFLMELLIMLLFFAISTSVCLRLFAKAHTLTEESRCLTQAVTYAQSAAAILKAEGMTSHALAGQWPLGQAADDIFLVYLSKDWKECREEEGVYCLRVTFAPEDIISAEISIGKISPSKSIYTLKVTDYQEVAYE